MPLPVGAAAQLAARAREPCGSLWPPEVAVAAEFPVAGTCVDTTPPLHAGSAKIANTAIRCRVLPENTLSSFVVRYAYLGRSWFVKIAIGKSLSKPYRERRLNFGRLRKPAEHDSEHRLDHLGVELRLAIAVEFVERLCR